MQGHRDINIDMRFNASKYLDIQYAVRDSRKSLSYLTSLHTRASVNTILMELAIAICL